MRHFKDRHGTDWPVDITLGMITRVKTATGVNLIDLVLGKASDDFGEDLGKQGELIWAVVEEEARSRGVTKEMLERNLDGESLESALLAIGQGTADFLPPSRREIAMKIFEKGQEVRDAAVKMVEARINQIDATALVKRLSDGPSSLPASSVLIPRNADGSES